MSDADVVTPPAPPVEPPADSPPDPRPDRDPRWPEVPPVDGRYYGFICPTHGTRMVAMTEATMLQLGTMIEGLRRSLADLSQQFKDQYEHYESLQRLYSDLQSRYTNLRNATRASRIAAAQKQIDTPQIITPDQLPFKKQIDQLVNDAMKGKKP